MPLIHQSVNHQLQLRLVPPGKPEVDVPVLADCKVLVPRPEEVGLGVGLGVGGRASMVAWHVDSSHGFKTQYAASFAALVKTKIPCLEPGK